MGTVKARSASTSQTNLFIKQNSRANSDHKMIGIIGSRRRNAFEDYTLLRTEVLKLLRPGDTFVSGGCKIGGDRFAEIIAANHDVPIKIHLPNKVDLDPILPKRVAYAKINYARNLLVANDSDVIIALVAPDRKGGTEDTVKRFLKRFGMTELTAISCGKLVLL